MRSLAGWLVAAILAVSWIGSCQRSERAIGALTRERDAARVAETRAVARRDSLAQAYRPQQAAAVAWKTRWKTLPVRWDTLEHTDTVRVPVEVLVTADSAIASCHVALRTCDERVAAEQAVTAAVRAQLRVADRLVARPWTATGLAWDPHAQQPGAFLDRDWGRLRAGLTVSPEARGARVQLRLGWRW